MIYEKPTRSAGLIVGGLCVLFAGQLTNVLIGLSGSAHDTWQVVGVVLQIVGMVGCILGVALLVSAVDAALLHRWTTAQESEARTDTPRGQQATPQD
ncbi:MAG: hypothetical protein QM779_09105 [Propionicimonas sp.]|uniref:hypothetical protein n=1 Tax=Propionicimonas sp. TaxID=1955623 RepID=UPI003D0DF721